MTIAFSFLTVERAYSLMPCMHDNHRKKELIDIATVQLGRTFSGPQKGGSCV